MNSQFDLLNLNLREFKADQKLNSQKVDFSRAVGLVEHVNFTFKKAESENSAELKTLVRNSESL